MMKNPVCSSGPFTRQCYQESSRFAHPRLRRSAAQHVRKKLTPRCGLEIVAGNADRPEMNDALATHDVVVRSQRSEEHTSELQSHLNLVCRLLLEKKHT